MRSLLTGLVVALVGCVTHEKEVVEKPAQPVEVVTPPPPPAKVIVVPNNN